MQSITFNWANDILISGLRSINSQLTHLVINSCKNVQVRNVNLMAPDLSPNTDGIHVQSSTGVSITGSTLQTGDDCISIGPGTSNLHISRIKCGPGHGVRSQTSPTFFFSNNQLLELHACMQAEANKVVLFCSIGSLGRQLKEDGVQNITLTDSVFIGSDNGVRIKTWARPSTSFVRNVLFQNIIMRDVENPIIIDQDYCPNNVGCPGQVINHYHHHHNQLVLVIYIEQFF